MFDDQVSIGPSPVNEPCANVGEADYAVRARKECAAYVRQLRRALGEEPEGAYLTVTRNAHDFGTYYDVVCKFDSGTPEAVDYAFRAEEQAPAAWDDQARAELGLLSRTAVLA